MHIGSQRAQKITNLENRNGHAPDPELRELLGRIRELVEEGALDRRQAADLEEAADEAGKAADEEGTRSSRFRRAMENLKQAAQGVTAITEAVDSAVRTVASP